MLQSCWKTAWLFFKRVNMDLLHDLSTLKCSPRERKPFILRLVHNRSQQFGVWWLPNWKLTCKKERSDYINIGVFVPAKTDGWIRDTWSNLAEAPRNSALWLGQINFSHTHAPPQKNIYDSMCAKFWKMKLSPWWQEVQPWVPGN